MRPPSGAKQPRSAIGGSRSSSKPPSTGTVKKRE
jgi:hypothetical protein